MSNCVRGEQEEGWAEKGKVWNETRERKGRTGKEERGPSVYL